MNKPIECYLTSAYPVPFLRLETSRECLSLPFATLLGTYLATDGNSLRLDFASYQVTVVGRRLYEVYCSISTGTCAALFARSETVILEAGADFKIPAILDIRVKPLD